MPNSEKRVWKWCLGSGIEVVDYRSINGHEPIKEIADGIYECPECGRTVHGVSRGNQPYSLARHAKPECLKAQPEK